jgi:CRISPR-associated endoribonuclease Cas6
MPTSTLALPSNLTLTHYRFILEALEPLHLPPYKGSALRGGFGHTFKRLVCTNPLLCHERCQLANECPYGYVFETSPPEGAEIFSRNQDVQRPFIIEPPRDRRELILPGERLNFGLTLIGHGMNLFPYFLAVFRELGWAGLGRTRGRYELLTIDAVSPYDGRVEDVYRADQQQIRITNLALNSEAMTAQAAELPTNRVTLEFLTPTRLKHKGRQVFEGPPFQALIKALLGRTSSLSYFHCGQRLETDFRGLIDQAASVKMVAAESHWEDWSRVSGRQKERINMGGLVGRVTYEGELEPFLPLLALGELIHVGKGTVFGNGQYRIVRGN